MFTVIVGKEKKSDLYTSANVAKLLQGMEPFIPVTIRSVPKKRKCHAKLRNVECGREFTPIRPNQEYCSPWCQNRSTTQKHRASKG